MILPIVLSMTPELMVDTIPLPVVRGMFLERWKAANGEPGRAGDFEAKAVIPVPSE